MAPKQILQRRRQHSGVCPQCGHPKLVVEENEHIACPGCGWQSHGPAQHATLLQVSFFIIKWSLLSSLILLLVFLAYQFLVWKEYSFEASYLQVRDYLVDGDIEAQMQMGTICNSLEKYECSVEYFSEVVQRQPQHRSALANLGIALTQLQQYKEARPHFEAYFSLGGEAYDVIFWYGRVLSVVENAEKGLEWYYFSLLSNPDYRQPVDQIVAELSHQQRQYEAISLIGGYLRGIISSNGELEREVYRLDDAAKKNTAVHPGEIQVDVPAIIDQLYYFPVSFAPEGRITFFTLNPNFEYVTINQDILDEHSLVIPAEAKEIEIQGLSVLKQGKAFRVPYLRLGPWDFVDEQVVFCEMCSPMVGRQVLNRFKISSIRKHRTEFLTLQRK